MAMGRVRQRSVYWVTAALVACMIGGYTMAALSTGGMNTSQQGSQTTTVIPIAGISWLSTNLTEIATSPPNACAAEPGCDLSVNSYYTCVGGFSTPTTCPQTDYAELIILNTTSVGIPAGHYLALTVFVTGTPVGGSPTTAPSSPAYYHESSGAPTPSNDIYLYFDIGSVALGGPAIVTSVTVIGNVI